MLAQAFVFPLLVAIILFAAAGRLDLALYWAYVAIISALSIAALFLIGEDRAHERLRPGGKPLPWSLRLAFLLCVLYWVIAGLDRGRFHWSDTVPLPLRLAALAVFTAGSAVGLWAICTSIRSFLRRCASRTSAGSASARTGPIARCVTPVMPPRSRR